MLWNLKRHGTTNGQFITIRRVVLVLFDSSMQCHLDI